MNIASIEQKAISVREHSQRLADELSSPGARGLAIVAQSQVAVMIDVQSLRGGGVRDAKMLEGLVERVMATMGQTKDNLEMVGRGCGK
jgi:chromosome segregation and condensation protein ScpB